MKNAGLRAPSVSVSVSAFVSLHLEPLYVYTLVENGLAYLLQNILESEHSGLFVRTQFGRLFFWSFSFVTFCICEGSAKCWIMCRKSGSVRVCGSF